MSRRRRTAPALFAAACAAAAGPAFAAEAGRTYHVASSGSDDNDGLSEASPWRTFAKVQAQTYRPGDRIRLRCGDTFRSPLHFDARSQGLPTAPIGLDCYGEGAGATATIDVSDRDASALVFEDTAGWSVANLRLVGAGKAPTQSGLLFFNCLRGDRKLPYVRIRAVEASGFLHGVHMHGCRDASGYSDVHAAELDLHDNVLSGMTLDGEAEGDAYNFTDVVIERSRFHGNTGKPGSQGNGVVISQTDRGVIQRSVAYANGALGGGGVGIWTWDSNAVVIQFNESYANRTSTASDGDGFDLDEGVTNSVLQYNYAYDNDGPGYLVWQNEGAGPHFGNTVRFNIGWNNSVGVKPDERAELRVGGTAALSDIKIYNNTFYTARPGSAAVAFGPVGAPTGTVIANNILYSAGPADLVATYGVDPAGVIFRGNLYAGPGKVRWAGRAYATVAEWRAARPDQETVDGADVSLAADPLLTAPGQGGAAAYALRPGSPAVGRGQDLSRLLGEPLEGAVDYYGEPARVEAGSGYSIGADAR